MKFSFEYLFKCLVCGIQYIPVTLELSFIPLFFGLVFGTFVALARTFRIPVVDRLCQVFVTVYSGVPLIVTLLIFHLVYLTCFKPIKYGAMVIACLVFSLSRIVCVSESVRGALLSIPKGQYEASYSCGLSTAQTLKNIIIPQVIPIALPSLTNNILGGLKNTSIVLTLGVVDVLNGATIPCADTYSYVEGYVAAAIIYWIINSIIETALVRFEKHLLKKR